jgi:hypothetical protein
MTHEKSAEKSSLSPQALRHKFKIIKDFDQFSKGIFDLHRGLKASTKDALHSLGRGEDSAAIGVIEHATPIDPFAYLSLHQSRGMVVARAAFQKTKLIKINPVTPFM